jgi:hypothetical protein
MNPESCFETDPWSYAAGLVKAGSLGAIKALAVQATVEKGLRVSAIERWQACLIDLLGTPEQSDVLETESATSILLRFPGSAIVRLFFDEGPGEPVCTFELVADLGLLVWRPDIHRLSWMQTPERSEAVHEHPYATALGKVVSP